MRRLFPSVPSIALLLFLVEASEGGSQEVPRFEPGRCPFEGGAWLDAERIDCGSLVVLENRERPDGRTLRLAVAILRSRSDRPRPDPVVFLAGGPGSAALRLAPIADRALMSEDIRAERDYILWDQRGTGFSEPAFCPDLTPRLLAADGPGATEDHTRALLEIVSECRERLEAEGLDLSAYNSVTSVQDLDDLRRTLGYEQWNLFGVSYGTRLALTAARDTPRGIRSMLLDAVSPPHIGEADEAVENFAASLHRVLERCALDDACSAEFPDLEERLYAALDDLERAPIEVAVRDSPDFPDGRIVIDGGDATEGLFQALRSPAFIEVLPYAIRELASRNGDLIASLVGALAPNPEANNPWLNRTVRCYEFEPLRSPAAAAEARARFPRLSWIADESAFSCDVWHPHRANAEVLLEPVVSNIPALLASGEFDPVTPARFARLVAEHLPNSQLIDVPGRGHGALPFSACTRDLSVSFLNNPYDPIDASCLGELPSLSLVTGLRVAPAVNRTISVLSSGSSVPLLVWAGATALLLASALIGWPLLVITRRRRREDVGAPTHDVSPGSTLGRVVAACTALVVLGFFLGLGLVARDAAAVNPLILAFGIPGSAAPLLWLPWFVAILSLGCLAFSMWAVQRRWWNVWSRVHYVVVTIGCASSVVVLAWLGFLSG